jgi:hypothetical protein
MSERRQRHGVAWAAIMLAVSAQACSPPKTASGVTPSAKTAALPVVSSTAPPLTATGPPATRSRLPSGASSTPPAAHVIVTATHGNVFIRRGPDFAFNAIGVLLNGQSVSALGRDVLAEWVQVPLPGQPNQMGWVSIQSQYTALDGDVITLPEVSPTYFPVVASLRNCTFHQMLITPGNIVLPSLDNFPANEIRVNPGAYVVVDTDVDGYPQVLKVEVREGSSIDVRVDGDGEKRKCPVP